MECQFCTQPLLIKDSFFCNDQCKNDNLRFVTWLSDFEANHSLSLGQTISNTTGKKETFTDIIKRTGGYPVHCAHKGGASAFAPENTLYACQKSVEHGARLLEIDLRVTKDMHLVLMHWSSVNETTDGKGYVSDYTLEELKKLDAAFKYDDLRGTGIKIPTLKEFLDTFVPVKDLLFLFDFKDCLCYKMAIKMIEHYPIEGRYVLGSVMSDANRLIRQTRPSASIPIIGDILTTLAVIAAYYTGTIRLFNFEHNWIGFVLCKPNVAFFNAGFFKAIKHCGIKTLVSGFGEEMNQELRLRQCIEYEIDYIMTDRPDLLQKLLEERKITS